MGTGGQQVSAAVPGRGRDVAVVHLVWAPLGPAPLRAFLDSYRAHQAGCAHELVVILNGLDAPGVGAQEVEALRAELAYTKHRPIELPGSPLDLAAYGWVMQMLEHERVCVLNSYSRMRCDGWLSMLDAALHPADVGLVGASGSWMSQSSYALFHLGLPSPYRRVYPDRRAMIAKFQTLQQHERPASPPRGPRAAFDTTRALLVGALSFPRFPEPHLRTNAFMSARELLTSLLPIRLRGKPQAYRLESGRCNITRRVQSMGLGVRVVDRFGTSFQPEEWPASATFWQGDQDALMVADNQSGLYERADADGRALLARLAWGEQAMAGGQ
jgi:hypothetical protein